MPASSKLLPHVFGGIFNTPTPNVAHETNHKLSDFHHDPIWQPVIALRPAKLLDLGPYYFKTWQAKT